MRQAYIDHYDSCIPKIKILTDRTLQWTFPFIPNSYLFNSYSSMQTYIIMFYTKDGRYIYPISHHNHSPEFLACIPGVNTTVLSLNVTTPSCGVDSGISTLERSDTWRDSLNLTHDTLSNLKWKLYNYGCTNSTALLWWWKVYITNCMP